MVNGPSQAEIAAAGSAGQVGDSLAEETDNKGDALLVSTNVVGTGTLATKGTDSAGTGLASSVHKLPEGTKISAPSGRPTQSSLLDQSTQAAIRGKMDTVDPGEVDLGERKGD
ncbi:MAG: hypothetical protein ACI8RA_000875 [Chlamydiales bacterium]|jgi:hypothetical protein